MVPKEHPRDISGFLWIDAIIEVEYADQEPYTYWVPA